MMFNVEEVGFRLIPYHPPPPPLVFADSPAGVGLQFSPSPPPDLTQSKNSRKI